MNSAMKTASAVFYLALGSFCIGLAAAWGVPFMYGEGIFFLGVAGLYAQARR